MIPVIVKAFSTKKSNPHNIDPLPWLPISKVLFSFHFVVYKHIAHMLCKKALFLFHLFTEYFPQRIVVFPDTLWQSSVIPFYVFSSVMGLTLAFIHKALLDLVCATCYMIKQLPQIIPGQFSSLSMFYAISFLHGTNLWRLLSSISLFLPFSNFLLTLYTVEAKKLISLEMALYTL